MSSPTAYLPLRTRMMRAGCWPTRGPSNLAYANMDPSDPESGETWIWRVDDECYHGCDTTDAANAIRVAAVEWLLKQDATFWFERGDEAHDIRDDYAIAFLNPEPSDDDRSWRGPDLDAALIAALDALLPKEEA